MLVRVYCHTPKIMNMEEAKLKLYVQAQGRKSASGRMQHSVQTAENPVEMSSRLQFLRWEAIHILATWVLNDVTQADQKRDDATSLVLNDLNFEIDLLLENRHKTILHRPLADETPSVEDEED